MASAWPQSSLLPRRDCSANPRRRDRPICRWQGPSFPHVEPCRCTVDSQARHGAWHKGSWQRSFFSSPMGPSALWETLCDPLQGLDGPCGSNFPNSLKNGQLSKAPPPPAMPLCVRVASLKPSLMGSGAILGSVLPFCLSTCARVCTCMCVPAQKGRGVFSSLPVLCALSVAWVPSLGGPRQGGGRIGV